MAEGLEKYYVQAEAATKEIVRYILAADLPDGNRHLLALRCTGILLGVTCGIIRQEEPKAKDMRLSDIALNIVKQIAPQLDALVSEQTH